MIALLCTTLIIGVFWAGAYFAAHSALALVGLGVCVVAPGFLVAVAETHGFEGQHVTKASAYTWHDLYLDFTRWTVARNSLDGTEPLYVQMPTGPQPVTGVFFARINHTMSVVLDSTPQADHDAEFNRLKQGVM